MSDDGVAFVDFSNAISTNHPGGILNEQATIYSIVNSLTYNLSRNSTGEDPGGRRGKGNAGGSLPAAVAAGYGPFDFKRSAASRRLQMRIDGRAPDQMRPIRITPNFIPTAEGSVLIEVGRTRVICTASVDEVGAAVSEEQRQGLDHLRICHDSARDAVRARVRESSTGKRSGRTQEIQRLIGRSLRTAIDLDKLGERTIWIDCDVIEADGGTRTASITGAFIALKQAIEALIAAGKLTQNPLRSHVAAVSVGVIGGAPMLDLNYVEDSTADVDFNLVMTEHGEFVEIQGTAERNPFGSRRSQRTSPTREKGNPGTDRASVKRLIVATTNPGKTHEMQSALARLANWSVEALACRVCPKSRKPAPHSWTMRFSRPRTTAHSSMGSLLRMIPDCP